MHPSRDVLRAFGFELATLEPITMGNINTTFRVNDRGQLWILQRLNPIFGAQVHHDIEAVTAHLEARNILTPRLRRTLSDELWTTDDEGGVWRTLTAISGAVLSEGATTHHCREAGQLLGRLHVAVADLDHSFCNVRPGVHDTAAHRAHLTEVLTVRRDHSAHVEVEPVGRDILAGLDELPPLEGLPPRIVHGDPKLNNVIFDSEGKALCFIDLDTFSRMTIPVELGDAFRSWCNPTGEDSAESTFDLELCATGLAGYASTAGPLVTAEEKRTIVPAIEMIALELAARFCADALEESYFGWNRQRFASASAHNLLRARSQLSLRRSIARQRNQLDEVVGRAFG